MLPHFIAIGAQKAGTTSLFHYLADHPQIYLHPIKEINYFAWPKEDRVLQRYTRFFKRAHGGAICGDVSTDYAKFPAIEGVPARIKELVPQVRLIYMVRHPVRRAISHYHHELLRGLRNLAPIDEELRECPDYVDFGRYHLQLEQYLKHFGSEQIRVIVLEEMIADKRTAMRQLFEHIGCDADFVPTNLHVRANTSEEAVQRSLIVHRLRALPGYDRIRFAIPTALRRLAVRAFSRRRTVLPWPTDDTRRWLADRLRRDVELLSHYLGRPDVVWNVDAFDSAIATSAIKSNAAQSPPQTAERLNSAA